MEYQFSNDLLGQPVAKCELECEAFADWLSNDLANDSTQISLLLDIIHKLQTHEINQYQHIGKIYHLQFDREEVELFLNNGAQDLSQENLEWDTEISAGCGLVDLQHLLNAWHEFTS